MNGTPLRLKLITATIGILVSVLILEVTLRSFKYAFVPFVGVTHNPCIYIEDEEIGFRFKSNSTGWLHRNFEMDNIVKINSAGFHDIERDAAKNTNGHQTILAVGDSFTAGIHVPVSETWTRVLEHELPNTSVINLGISGTGTDAHLAILKEQLPIYQPETVILAFYQNDIADIQRKKRFIDCHNGYNLYYEDAEQKRQLARHVDENRPTRVNRWLFDRIYTFRIASRYLLPSGRLLRTNRVSPSMIGLEISSYAGGQKDINQLLREFQQLSEKWDFRLLVIPVPARSSTTGSLDTLRANALPALLEELEVVDISLEMNSLRESQRRQYSDLFWKYDGHFNSAGNKLFGLAVAQTIEQMIRDQ